jgi:hypothetical protein
MCTIGYVEVYMLNSVSRHRRPGGSGIGYVVLRLLSGIEILMLTLANRPDRRS